MSTLTDFIVNYGNVIELNFPKWDCLSMAKTLNKHTGWVYYQPQKPGYNRYGLSVTSLDGKFTGEPDLFSLREYAQLTGKVYTEKDFKVRTNVTAFLPEIDNFLDFWEPNLGRVHFLKLNKGGFFPPHRDNGLVLDVQSFRILVPIHNFGTNDMKWIQNEEVLNLKIGHTYFINTCLPHSLFSFVDDCVMLVLNIMVDDLIIEKMVKKIVPV